MKKKLLDYSDDEIQKMSLLEFRKLHRQFTIDSHKSRHKSYYNLKIAVILMIIANSLQILKLFL